MLRKFFWGCLLLIGLFAFTGIAQVSNSKEPQPKVLGVKTKNGSIVLGAINGTLVQKNAGENKTAAGTTYYGTYVFTKGEYVDSIDEHGVHTNTRGYSFIASVNAKTKLDDIAVFKKYLDDSGAVKSGHEGTTLDFGGDSGMTVEANLSTREGPYGGPKNSKTSILGIDKIIDDLLETAPRCSILGTYVKDKEQGKYKIIPALEVNTDKGIVTIPVGDIVEFKTAAKQ